VPQADPKRKRCAVYTRKSSEEGLEQEFNSLAAQREACEAYIRSQQHEGWVLAKTRYDDGGFSGGTIERPALQHLLADIRAGRIDIMVVYKVDRLTRALAGLCHGNANEHALRAKLAKRHAAATAPCHCAVASDRKIRSVDREMRWRCRLKVLWTAACMLRKRWADRADLKRCCLRSRRRTA
jgi:Resolvase, N terminal domain